LRSITPPERMMVSGDTIKIKLAQSTARLQAGQKEKKE
jgi:hypothetical protein